MKLFDISQREEKQLEELYRLVEEKKKEGSLYMASKIELNILLVFIILMIALMLGGLLLK